MVKFRSGDIVICDECPYHPGKIICPCRHDDVSNIDNSKRIIFGELYELHSVGYIDEFGGVVTTVKPLGVNAELSIAGFCFRHVKPCNVAALRKGGWSRKDRLEMLAKYPAIGVIF